MRKFILRVCAETRRNSGKTKTTGVTTISGLPSYTRLGTLSHRDLMERHWTGNMSKMATRTAVKFTNSLKFDLSDRVALLAIFPPFPNFLSLLFTKGYVLGVSKSKPLDVC